MSSAGLGRPLTVALLGGGTVGASVARLLLENARDMEERVGAPVVLTAVAVAMIAGSSPRRSTVAWKAANRLGCSASTPSRPLTSRMP